MITLAGILSVLLALIFLPSPAASLLAALWVIGAYAILYGVIMFYMAFRIRRVTALLEKTGS